MRTLLFILFVCFCNMLFAQSPDDSSAVEIIDFPDVEAEFPGGSSALMRYLATNYEFPQCDVEAADYTVLTTFIVHADGHVSTIEIEQGVHPQIDQAVIDVIQKMPHWIPAKNNGVPVASKVRIPVRVFVR